MKLLYFAITNRERRLASHPFVLRKAEINDALSKESARQWFTVDAHAPVLLAWGMWVAAEGKIHQGLE